MNIFCEFGRYNAEGKIECVKRACPCGHVYFCQMNGRYQQTRQADSCPVRFQVEEEKPKKRGKKK